MSEERNENEKDHVIQGNRYYARWTERGDPAALRSSYECFVEAVQYQKNELFSNPRHLHALLRVYYEYGATDAALDVASHVIDNFPRYAEIDRVMFDFASLLRFSRKYEESRTFFTHLIRRLPPGYDESHITLEIARTFELEEIAKRVRDGDDEDAAATVVRRLIVGAHIATYRVSFRCFREKHAARVNESKVWTDTNNQDHAASTRRGTVASTSSVESDVEHIIMSARRTTPSSLPPQWSKGALHWYRSCATFYSHGVHCYKNRSYLNAVDSFREALRRRVHDGETSGPHTPSIYIELGRAHFMCGFIQQSLSCFERAYTCAAEGDFHPTSGETRIKSRDTCNQYMSVAREKIVTMIPESASARRIQLEERSALMLQSAYRRTVAVKQAEARRDAALVVTRVARGALGRMKARRCRIAENAIRRRVRRYARRRVQILRRTKYCERAVRENVSRHERRVQCAVLNALRVAISWQRHKQRTRRVVISHLRRAIVLRQEAEQRCRRIRRIWLWRFARDTFDRWCDKIARRRRLNVIMGSKLRNVRHLHFQSWRATARRSRAIRFAAMTAWNAGRDAQSAAHKASDAPRLAEETLREMAIRREFERVFHRNQTLAKCVRRIFAAKCLREWRSIAHLMCRLRASAVASRVLRLGRWAFQRWKDHHIKCRAMQKMGAIHLRLSLRGAVRQLYEKAEISRRNEFLTILKRHRRDALDAWWNKQCWTRRIEAGRFEEIHVDAAKRIQRTYRRFYRTSKFFRISAIALRLGAPGVLRVQKMWRGQRGRRRYRYLRRHRHAVTIQKIWRGYRARRHVRRVRRHFRRFWSQLVLAEMNVVSPRANVQPSRRLESFVLKRFPCARPGHVMAVGVTSPSAVFDQTPRFFKKARRAAPRRTSPQRRLGATMPTMRRQTKTTSFLPTLTTATTPIKWARRRRRRRRPKRERVVEEMSNPRMCPRPLPPAQDVGLLKAQARLRKIARKSRRRRLAKMGRTCLRLYVPVSSS